MYLIPQPKKLIVQETFYIMPYTGRIVIRGMCDPAVNRFAGILKGYLAQSPGFDYQINRGDGAGVISLAWDAELGKEHYNLQITPDGIMITGGDNAAILHGIHTLRQILLQKGAALPVLTIDDAPTLPNRGYFFDTTRGRVPTLATLKALVDLLAQYKLNQLQLYVEHSFLFEGFSEVWRDDTPLTAQEILELDQYCADREIELIPALASFGHLYKVLSTQSFCHLCELEDAEQAVFSFEERMNKHTLDISQEDSFELVKSRIMEYMPLFRSRKFNICADETFDLGKGKNQDRAKSEGISGMYMEFLGKLCRFIVEQEHTPMFWGDIILNFPELVDRLPHGTVCLNWGYSPEETAAATETFAQVGVNQYVCPGVRGWNRLINLFESAYRNITKMCRYGKDNGALGMLNTDWGDYGHINHPAFSIPGLICGAAFSWSDAELSFPELNRQISRVEYLDRSEGLMEIASRLSEQVSFAWMPLVRFKEMHEQGETQDSCNEMLQGQAERIRTAAACNAEIEKCIKQLSETIIAMDSSMRARVSPYLLAAEGMHIFNQLGVVLLNSLNGLTSNGEKAALASELESWYYRYRMLWYQVSRKSELYRISQVIFWYADYLRRL